MNSNVSSIISQLAAESAVTTAQVNAFVSLYDDGNTVPFIARYRKEATNGLDDVQLRLLETRLTYLRELEMRRNAVLKALSEQGNLTDKLKGQINAAPDKTTLEDLYQPFKSKRISKGQLAIDAGLEPLADKLWFHNETDVDCLAKRYINSSKGFPDAKSVLTGAQLIIVERIAADAALLDKLRKHLFNNAALVSTVVKGQEQNALKFKDYFEFQEPLKKISSHRLLAMLRGKSEGLLKLKLNADPRQDKSIKDSYCETLIASHLGFSFANLTPDSWRKAAVKKAWKSKISTLLETQLISSMKEKSFDSAIDIFAGNLKELLMAAPAGRKVVLGLDPGLRTGCKAAVISETGKLLDYATIYPHAPAFKTEQSAHEIIKLINKYKVDLIAIGNGTASRESDSFVRELLNEQGLTIPCLIVSEAGASVYSASELASQEFPDLDVSIRGAVSIARRLQDPLAELVKIDAKAIGVGLYQHDLNQTKLARRLQTVVEDCVNAVGVDLNSASVSLLSFIAGLNKTIAQNIVDYRDTYGAFKSRNVLKKVARLGDKAFQQSAGFLRISEAVNPLDNSAVHPEAYALVKEIAVQQGRQVKELVNNPLLLNNVNAQQYVNEQFGLLSITDILSELAKPGRDPRPEFKTVSFAEGINKPAELINDMVLQGVVSNVTSFGAFVDIGVHQDGLVHISQLADKFVSDPFQVVKTGQIVKVRVVDVDLQRGRIALSMRLQHS
ncbi:Tex family protein [Psychromonas aquimarina]|uniref:Tex family protein n=1 Tax=Psychromonas aquimarina TaxID=444919 RepID=UPI0004183CE0|nr:Tex family protein [Psychromonas aquimarina]